MIARQVEDTAGHPSRAEWADFFVEWSDAQHCFHVIPATNAMHCNFRAWLDGRSMDYRPLAQFFTEDEAYAFIAATKKLRPVAAEEPQP